MCGITIAIFQSTLPTRGSDDIIAYMRKKHNVISIHAPHEGERLLPIGYLDISPTISIHAPHEGERHYFAVDDYYVQFISIHAPHEGERLLAPASFNVFIVFQSTLPTRGSDTAKLNIDRTRAISIHAPHEGERLCVCLYATAFNAFQSTLPTRGSDDKEFYICPREDFISIHAPHEGERPI